MKAFIKKIYLRWFYPVQRLIWDTIQSYQKDRVMPLGAALAYYTIFSLPALLVVLIASVGFFFGEAAVRGEIYESLMFYLGKDAALQVQNAVKGLGGLEDNRWTAVFGVLFLLFIASGVFNALQSTLNQIFEVEEVEGPKKAFFLLIINRFLSLGMIFSLGAVVLVSIVSNALLMKLTHFIRNNHDWLMAQLPKDWLWLEDYLEFLTSSMVFFLNAGVSIGLICFFFALIFKILPAVRIPWNYTLSGALLSAVLFWLGEMVMSFYLSRTQIISAYGAAGSIIILLMWVYYSSQLLFFGAEFIKTLARHRGRKFRAKPFARAKRRDKASLVVVEEDNEKSPKEGA